MRWAAERDVWRQAVGKALREREQALLTLHALEAELRRKRKGIGSLEQEGSQVTAHAPATCRMRTDTCLSHHPPVPAP